MTAIAGPWEQGETEVDDGGVEGVDRVRHVDAERLVDIQFAGRGNEALGEVGIDAPVPRLVGVRERRARDARANPHVIQLGLYRAKTGFDIAEALAISELRERHAEKLIPAGETRRLVITTISCDAPLERGLRHVRH